MASRAFTDLLTTAVRFAAIDPHRPDVRPIVVTYHGSTQQAAQDRAQSP
jgi:hypothetical protein